MQGIVWGGRKTFFEEKSFPPSPSPTFFSKNLFLPFAFLPRKKANGDLFFWEQREIQYLVVKVPAIARDTVFV